MMDRCNSPNSSLAYLYHDELGLHEEFRHCLLYTAELEVAVLSAKEEVAKRDFEILHLKDVLGSTIRERNEAQSQCHKLLLEKLLLQQHLLQLQQQQQEKDQDHRQRRRRDAPLALAASDHQDETKAADSSNSQRFNYTINSLDDACNQKIKEASRFADPDDVVEKAEEEEEEEEEEVEEQVLIQLAGDRPLPEKGQLLQAVKEAGPLLHTLLLAGPLPQWQHPPPQLNSIDIPPITVSVSVSSTTNISSPSFPILTPRRIFDQDSFNSSNAASSASCFSKKRGLEQLYCSTRDLDSSSPPPPPPPPLPPNSNKHQKKAVASYCSDLH